MAWLFSSKARVKLSTVKLYEATGGACGEILKIAQGLYKAWCLHE